jgi:hypothetical protein
MHGCFVDPKMICFSVRDPKGVLLGVQTGVGFKIVKSIENMYGNNN